jgi:hypothetical protein
LPALASQARVAVPYAPAYPQQPVRADGVLVIDQLPTARREALIEHNPCDDAVLPHRPAIEEDEDIARPFPRIEVEKPDSEKEIIETMEQSSRS